ncbi:hypothetical protein AB0M79_09785 [Polymorphospora sp. NPDC051019]|uniref:hypothetical protein n=1 Tax=Polymorphospora sp. NPDC051019 TaxID=3155725 RepID=UPI003447D6F9
MVAAEVLFAVSDLVIVPESLGAVFDVTRPDDAFTVTVQLPSTPNSFRPRQHQGLWWSFLAPSDASNPEWVKISYVRVVLVFPRRIQPDEIDPTQLAAFDAAVAMSDTAIEVGGERLAGFLESVRVDRQFWLGLSLERPPIVDGPHLFDDADGRHDRLPVASRGTTVMYGHGEADRVTPQAFARAAAAVVAGTLPSIEDRLLADARAVLRRGPRALLPQALVLAAMSTEIRIKSTLEQHATDAQRDLVQIMLTSPRDYSLAACSLFDRPLKAVTGRSLRQDDPKLWKAADALFQDRNKVAHRGATHDEASIRGHIATAVRLKDYLADLATSRAAQ